MTSELWTLFALTLVAWVVGHLAIGAAYRNGVRDGYSNTWLPHVKKQIQDENLQQGRRA